ncbi:MAG: cell division FtsA domain-containing protein [Patescibacteria group bacterium]|nr:cell division FtsA domain-containing protein [Patescibacteria group bacterium]
MFPAINLFKSKSSTPCYLSLDVGSGSCKALSFSCVVLEGESEERKRIKALGAGSVSQNSSEMSMGVPADIKAVTNHIGDAVDEATLPLEGLKIKNRILGLSGEMISFLTTRMRLTRANPDKPISKKEIARIERKAQQAAFLEAHKELAARKGYQDLDLEIVDSAITGVEVDGFPATEPEGFKGEKVELSYFNSFAPQDRLYTLESILRNLKLKPQLVTASMYALLHALLENSPSTGVSSVLIDMGADKTDVGVVFDSSIVSNRTLPIGGRDFTEAIAHSLEISFSEAEGLKRNYSEDGDDNARIQSAVADVLEVWSQGLIDALMNIKEVKAFPPQVNIYGGGAEFKVVLEHLRSLSWKQNLPFHSDPRVSILRPEDFDFFEDETGQVSKSDWVVPVVLSWFGCKVL